jgi:hypothetical protein
LSTFDILVLHQQQATKQAIAIEQTIFEVDIEMGKGKCWKSEEDKYLAEAWVAASEEQGEPMLKGRNQNQYIFVSKVVAKFIVPSCT